MQERIKIIIDKVVEVFEVSENKLYGDRRLAEISDARLACYYLLRKYTSLSLQRTAQVLFRGDHTTAKYGASRAAGMIDVDSVYRSKINKIENALKEKGIEPIIYKRKAA